MLISVIIPTYREAENLRIIVPRVFHVLEQADMEGEVIVVDDDSPDGTAETARELARDYPVRVHVRRDERGLATAVMKGFELAAGGIVVVMDADLSHPDEKIPEMVRPILEDRCDITVGSRYVSGGGCGHWPLSRRLISRSSGLMARGVAKLSDPTSGFMAVRKAVLNKAVLDPVGWKIVLEVVVKTGARVEEVPIVFADRGKGQSKLNLRVQAEYIAHLMRLYHFRYRPLFEFVKFCITGLIGLFVDTAVLVGFVEVAGFDPRSAAVFAFLAAVSSNYVLNRLWTFRSGRSTRVVSSYVRFVVVCVAGLALRVGIMHLLIKFCGMGVGYRYVAASVIGIMASTAFNFAGTKFLAFSAKPAGRKRSSSSSNVPISGMTDMPSNISIGKLWSNR